MLRHPRTSWLSELQNKGVARQVPSADAGLRAKRGLAPRAGTLVRRRTPGSPPSLGSGNLLFAVPVPVSPAGGELRPHGKRSAFTLIELLIVIVLIGIVVGLAYPTLNDTKELQLREAARMLAADIEFAQNDSLAHADNPRQIQFDLVNNQYRIADTLHGWAIPGRKRNKPILTTADQGYSSTLNSGQMPSGLASAIAAQGYTLHPQGGVAVIQLNSRWEYGDNNDNSFEIRNTAGTLTVLENDPYLVSYGTGRAAGLPNVVIQSVQFDPQNKIAFDTLGSPQLSADGCVTLSCGPETMTVHIDKTTGEVRIP